MLPGIVKGYVKDAATGTGIAGATITILGTTGSFTTGTDGIYFIQLASGSYTLRTAKTGYITKDVTVTIPAGDTITKNIKLQIKE